MNVFFFGDSLCVGQFVSPHRVWVTRIAEKLEGLAGSEKIVVTNASVNGNTTRMALERVSFDVQSHGIDLILIQFGANDCNYWATDKGHPRVSKMAFKANLLEIIDRSRIFGAKEVFLNTNNPSAKTLLFDYAPTSYQQSCEEYNQLIREVALSSKVHLIDIDKIWRLHIGKGVPLETLLLADGIHLSVAGHDLYFDTVYPYIEKAVKGLLKAKG
jgi:acyl-CoA thioesterase-1